MKKLINRWKFRFAIWKMNRSMMAWTSDVIKGEPEVSLQKIAAMKEQVKNEKWEETLTKIWLPICAKLERYCQAKIQMRNACK